VIVRRGSGHDPSVTGASPLEAGRIRVLVELHFDFIWRVLRRHGLSPPDADDGAQQVFMIATQKLDAILAGSEQSFLYGVALRVASNARRSTSRRRRWEETDDAPGATAAVAASSSPDERAELGRAWSFLEELLAQMPEDLGRVLALAEIEQLEVPEIALLEQIPVGTAASRLRRARAVFRELLGKAQHRNPFSSGDA
jgi:RNA polymerase sigma-70 factor (ECF subfamily)